MPLLRSGTDRELAEWYYGEVRKLGLSKTDAPAIFFDDGPIKQCQLVPLPDGKTREQLEEILSELKGVMGIEPAEC